MFYSGAMKSYYMEKTMKVTLEVYHALTKSIKKWDDIVDRTGVDKGRNNCALCQMFLVPNGDCTGCPIWKETGQNNCHFEEYDAWKNTAKTTKKGNLRVSKNCLRVSKNWGSGAAAIGMLNFLRRLKKKCEIEGIKER